MQYIFLKTKIITGLITGGILLSSVSITFAVTSKTLYFDGKVPFTTNECKQMNIKTRYGLETNSENLVANNNIIQKEANKIKMVINRNKPVKKVNFEKTENDQRRKIYVTCNKINHINPYTVLVNNGIITESQAEKIIMKQIYLQHIKMLKSVL